MSVAEPLPPPIGVTVSHEVSLLVADQPFVLLAVTVAVPVWATALSDAGLGDAAAIDTVAALDALAWLIVTVADVPPYETVMTPTRVAPAFACVVNDKVVVPTAPFALEVIVSQGALLEANHSTFAVIWTVPGPPVFATETDPIVASIDAGASGCFSPLTGRLMSNVSGLAPPQSFVGVSPTQARTVRESGP